jgi:hypothetical protein
MFVCRHSFVYCSHSFVHVSLFGLSPSGQRSTSMFMCCCLFVYCSRLSVCRRLSMSVVGCHVAIGDMAPASWCEKIRGGDEVGHTP